MARKRNTDVNEKPFGQTTVKDVWQKGRAIAGYDSSIWRHDICGRVMKFAEYGNTDSQHGWEVDHICNLPL